MKKPESDLLADVEAFLKRTGMTPTRFGVLSTGERGLVKRLRRGRTVQLATAERLWRFMATHKPGKRVGSGKRMGKSNAARLAA
jgi:hypothetical protein